MTTLCHVHYAKKARLTDFTRLIEFTGLTGFAVDVDRVDIINKVYRIDTVDKVDRVDRVDKVDTVDRVDKVDRVYKVDRVDRVEC